MKVPFAAAGVILLWLGTPASAHRLDEYLQATTISVEKDRIQAQVRLTPGVAVFPAVFAAIDTNADGVVSEPEQRTYAARVVRDLSFTIDGAHLQPRLISIKFSDIAQLKEGQGEIQLELDADLPRGGLDRKLIFENHHESRMSAYLVNSLVPRDPDIRIKAQNRNYQQSYYQLDYAQVGLHLGPFSFARWPNALSWLCTPALFLSARLALLWRKRLAIR